MRTFTSVERYFADFCLIDHRFFSKHVFLAKILDIHEFTEYDTSHI